MFLTRGYTTHIAVGRPCGSAPRRAWPERWTHGVVRSQVVRSLVTLASMASRCARPGEVAHQPYRFRQKYKVPNCALFPQRPWSSALSTLPAAMFWVLWRGPSCAPCRVPPRMAITKRRQAARHSRYRTTKISVYTETALLGHFARTVSTRRRNSCGNPRHMPASGLRTGSSQPSGNQPHTASPQQQKTISVPSSGG